MRGAFGKPQGTVARVHIGQPIMSVRARENHQASVIEALRRAKFKFPGRQKVPMIALFINIVSYLLCLPQASNTVPAPSGIACRPGGVSLL